MAACRVTGRHRCASGRAGYVVALARSGGPGGAQKLAASVSAKGKKGSGVEVLSLPDLRQVRELHTPHGDTTADELVFLQKSPDCLITCGQGGCVKLWDTRAKGGGPQRVLRQGGDDPAVSVSASADDGMCACAVGCSIRAIDIGSGKELFAHEDAHSEPVSQVRFHPQRAHELISAGDDGLLCGLDVRKCQQGQRVMEDEGLRLVMNNSEAVRHLSFAGEGRDIACTVSTTEVLQLFSLHDAKPGELCGRFAELPADPHLLVEESNGSVVEVFYDDGSGRAHALASAVDGRLALFHMNMEGASFAAELPGEAGGGHTELVRAAAELGGGLFATGGEDGHVLVWSPEAAAQAEEVPEAEAAAPAPRKRRRR